MLNQTLTELDITCLPGNIPQSIEIDITDLNIGDSIRLGQLSLSEGLSAEGDDENLIIAVNEQVQESIQEDVDDSMVDDSSASEEEETSQNDEEQSE